MISYRYMFTILAIPTSFGMAAPAFAADDVRSPAADEIIVTATRGTSSAQDIAARVEVITRDEMELKNYVTAVDALKSVPGLSVVQSGGAGTLTSVFSRGTNSKHTLALYDGIRLNDASSPNGQFNFGSDTLGDLERIEVLRGPASAVYGSDAIGGVINFIPRIGGDTAFAPYVELSGGDLDTYRGMAGAAGTVNAFSYGLTAEYFETGGFNNVAERISDNLDERDGSHFVTLTANAALDVTEGLTLRGLARFRDAESDLDDAALDRTGRGGKDRYFLWRIAPRLVALNGQYQGDLEFGQVDNERSDWNDPDENNAFGGPDSGADGLRTFAAWRNRIAFAPSDTLSGSLRAGLEWQREKISTTGGYSDPLSRSEEQTAIYGQAQISALDRLELSGSLRHDDPEAFDAVTTWNAGAVVLLPEIGGRIYASYGTSFKAPSLSERFSESAYNVGNPALKPENGKSFEVGLDAGADIGATGWIGVTATYFDTRIRNLIEYDFALLANVNIGKAAIDGFELGLKAQAGDIANLQVNYTQTNAFNDTTAERLLRRPKHGWSASLVLTPVETVSLSLDYFRRGSREDVLYAPTSMFGPGGGYLGNGTVAAYDIVNLSARYELTEQVELFANLRNAFDEEYEEPDSYRGAPRSWTVGARARF